MKRKINVICPERQYLGVGFIKSRKSDSKIMDMSEKMVAMADSKSLKLLEIIVDQGSSRDIDRPAIDELAAWMEQDDIKAIVVRSVFDISDDAEDLQKFLYKAEQLSVSVYEMEDRRNLAYILQDSGFCSQGTAPVDIFSGTGGVSYGL